MSRRNTVVDKQVREMVQHVHSFLHKEAENGASNLKQVQKRTAIATNTSVATVRRIMKKGGEDSLSVFKTPGKKRSRAKPITGVETFDQGVIKRCIHNFHIAEKELLTMEKLRKKLKVDINYQGSERSLRRIIKNLGFYWKRTQNNKRILIERSNIRYQRIEYLQQLREYREEGRPIIYTAETYVDASLSTAKTVPDNSNRLKKPIPKGQRVGIVHAGSETGFLSNALHIFKADVKTGYHNNMKFDNYEKWLRTQLIPNLPNNSVVVVENTLFHNKQSDAAPIPNAKKVEMMAWLTDKNINYTEDMLKPELYNLIRSQKDLYKKFSVDKILAEHNHTVLWLPRYHPDFNPIEMAWTAIKGYVSSKNVNLSVQGVIDLIKEKVALIAANDWTELCQKVRDIEAQYEKSDHLVDMMTEEFIVRLDDDGSDVDNSDDDDSNNEESTDDEDDMSVDEDEGDGDDESIEDDDEVTTVLPLVEAVLEKGN